jgi:serine protease Do
MRISFIVLFVILLTCRASGQTFADLVEKVDSSVVQIHVLEQRNTGMGKPNNLASAEGFGTGTLVGDEKKYILTAAHVVSDATKIQVEFRDGTTVDATNRRIDKIADVAIIQLAQPVKHFPAATIGNSDEVRIGDDVFIIGNPLGLAHSVSRGIVSSKHSEKSKINDKRIMEFFQTDAAINKGNSGGPMFNMKGEIVGVVSSILSFSGGFEGLGFAATSNIAEEILMQRGRIWFGTDVLLMSPEMCKIFNVPQEGAVLVQNVVENSPAYFMGLKGGYLNMKVGDSEFLAGGDIILQFDEIPFDSQENLEKFWENLNSVPQNHEYLVKIYRNGERKTLQWRLIE